MHLFPLSHVSSIQDKLWYVCERALELWNGWESTVFWTRDENVNILVEEELSYSYARQKTLLNIFQSLTLNKITLKILKAFIYHYLKFTSCFNENTIKYIILWNLSKMNLHGTSSWVQNRQEFSLYRLLFNKYFLHWDIISSLVYAGLRFISGSD